MKYHPPKMKLGSHAGKKARNLGEIADREH
jgi:hypothetical protein